MGKRGSVKQVEANRRNAQRSTGPKTVAGKRAVRWNAIKHGLLACTAVIPRSGENKAEFQRLLAGLVESLQPVGILEGLLVEEIASVSWRRRRATRAETGEIEHQLDRVCDAWDMAQAAVLEKPRAARDASALQQTAAGLQMLIEIFDGVAREIRDNGRLSAESVAWLEASWEWTDEEVGAMRAEKELTGELKKELLELLAEARKKFRVETKAAESREAAERDVELAREVVPSEVVSEKLLRYERAMDRKLHAAIAQLERLQQHRRGATVPPPTQ